MAKMKILAGDMKPGTAFYTVPGAINDEPVASVYEAEPGSVDAFVRGPLGRGLGPKVWFVANLAAGGKILVQTDPRTYRQLVADLGDEPVSRDYVAARRAENRRAGFLLIGLAIPVWFVLGRLFQSWAACVLAVCAALAITLGVGVLLARRGGRSRPS
jgi:hypothetical protein